MMGRFRRFINDCELKELYLHGRRYTLSNERENPTLVRLDRVFCIVGWEGLHPSCSLRCMSSVVSDHCLYFSSVHLARLAGDVSSLRCIGLSWMA
jgi:hypothetical protein